MRRRIISIVVIAGGLVLIWTAMVGLTGVPRYILPSPKQVAGAIWTHAGALWGHFLVTAFEMLMGLMIGTALGVLSAICMIAFRPAKRWLLPVLVISQAIPVFALAPILVLWLGYGMGSKISMAVLIIFFPVMAAFYDGLRRTDPEWLELARVMNASNISLLWHIRVPAALPALASGMRVAASVAPIGAVVGEWVGASRGLGFYMLYTNARMQTDVMFAALAVLALAALLLYFSIDRLMSRLVYWQHENGKGSVK